MFIGLWKSYLRRDKGLSLGLICLAALSVAPAKADPFELYSHPDGTAAHLKMKVDLAESPPPKFGPNYTWITEQNQPGAEYVRLYFTDIAAQTTDFTLSFYDAAGSLVEAVSGTDFSDRTDYTSLMIPGDYVQVRLTAVEPPQVRFTLDQLLFQQDAARPESITPPYQLEHVRAYRNHPVISKASPSVAKLIFTKDGKPHNCTGFLIANDLLMTNHHCVPTADICRTTVAVFGYEYDAERRLQNGQQYRCASVKASNRPYDFAVLELKASQSLGSAPGRKAGEDWGVLPIEGTDPQSGQDLIIIQHPSGYPKLVSVQDCNVVEPVADGRAEGSDFSHLCDTYGGSSGSPILNAEGRVVGLHHFGFAEGPYWNSNRAVRISKIREIYTFP